MPLRVDITSYAHRESAIQRGLKKRLAQLQPFPTSVAALAFNADGSKLAIASSYCFEEGEKDHPKDELYVHTVLNHEVTPKASQPSA